MADISREEFMEIVEELHERRIPIKAMYRHLKKGVLCRVQRCFANARGEVRHILKFSESLHPDEPTSALVLALIEEVQITYERDLFDKKLFEYYSQVVINYPSTDALAVLTFNLTAPYIVHCPTVVFPC